MSQFTKTCVVIDLLIFRECISSCIFDSFHFIYNYFFSITHLLYFECRLTPRTGTIILIFFQYYYSIISTILYNNNFPSLYSLKLPRKFLETNLYHLLLFFLVVQRVTQTHAVSMFKRCQNQKLVKRGTFITMLEPSRVVSAQWFPGTCCVLHCSCSPSWVFSRSSLHPRSQTTLNVCGASRPPSPTLRLASPRGGSATQPLVSSATSRA